MYGIYANIWGILMVNVTIYSSTMDPKGHDGWYQLDALICLVPSWVILSDSGRGAISILDLHRCNGGICHSLLHAGAHCRTCGLSRLVIKTAVGISTVTIWWSSDLLGIFSKLPKKTGSTTLPPFNWTLWHCPRAITSRYCHRWPSLSKHVQAARPVSVHHLGWTNIWHQSTHAAPRGIQKPWNGFGWDISMFLFVAGFIWLVELMCLGSWGSRGQMAQMTQMTWPNVTCFLMSMRIINENMWALLGFDLLS